MDKPQPRSRKDQGLRAAGAWNTKVADLSKLVRLLDDPEVRMVVFGLAHVGMSPLAVEAGAPRLRAVVVHLGATTDPDQYRSWLADDVSNGPMTVDQVWAALGADAINDVAQYAGCSPDNLAWQLAVVLPDLVDAFTPEGRVLAASELGTEISAAIAECDQSAGPFGQHVH